MVRPGSSSVLAALRALADPARLAVARLLAEGALTVGEVQQALGLGQSTVSHHLKVLADAGLLDCSRDGRLAFYRWGAELTPEAAALRSFVHAHAPLPADVRRRMQGVFEGRTERARRFFDSPQGGPSVEAAGLEAVAPMLARLPRCGLLLDVGTGTGRLLGTLRARAAGVVGIDASARMLEQARSLVDAAGWRNVELRRGSVEDLPVADGEADAVFAHLVLHHAARPERALAEAYRVLRPGGVLVVGDYLPHREEWMREQLADQWLGLDPARVLAGLSAAGFALATAERLPAAAGVPGVFVAAALRGGDAARTRWFRRLTAPAMSSKPLPARAGRARPAHVRRGRRAE